MGSSTSRSTSAPQGRDRAHLQSRSDNGRATDSCLFGRRTRSLRNFENKPRKCQSSMHERQERPDSRLVDQEESRVNVPQVSEEGLIITDDVQSAVYGHEETKQQNSQQNYELDNVYMAATASGPNDMPQESSSNLSTDQHIDAAVSNGQTTGFHGDLYMSLRGDSSGREASRNSRRRFWEALSRAAAHRRSTSPIAVVAIDDDASSASIWNHQHSQSSSESEPVVADGSSSYVSHDWDERRQQVRSQVWALQRLSGGLELSSVHSRSCFAGGRSRRGYCLCDNCTINENSNARASISRIIMLAEALFEVLDEIHNQSVALSGSAAIPLSSLPAPSDVVDRIAVRTHKKSKCMAHISEDVAQCYICLTEYEDGDHVRILPCHHEYHKSCVDKWLKEVHRVCPLCRTDVCELAFSATAL